MNAHEYLNKAVEDTEFEEIMNENHLKEALVKLMNGYHTYKSKQPPTVEGGEVEDWRLKDIQRALDLTVSIYRKGGIETAYDRQVEEAREHVKYLLSKQSKEHPSKVEGE